MPYDDYPSLDDVVAGSSSASQKPRWPTRRGHQGPASDLPMPGDDLWPIRIASQNSPFGIETGFSRAFDFSDPAAREPIKGYDPDQSLTIGQRSKQFIDQFFGGVESLVDNPATGKPYGNELRLHDAFHQYANLGNTLRGEEQVTVGEKAGNTPLLGHKLEGLTQQPGSRNRLVKDALEDPFELSSRGEGYATGMGMRRGGTLVQQRGQTRGSSLFKDRNAVTSFLSPAIGDAEAAELARRGREFYDQVASQWNQYLRGRLDRPAEGFTPDQATIHDLRNDFLDDARNMVIEGGYGGSGKMPYGPMQQFMNAPLVPTVRSDDYRRALDKRLATATDGLQAAVKAEEALFNSPDHRNIRDHARWLEDSRQLSIAEGNQSIGRDYKLPPRLEAAGRTYLELRNQDMKPDDAMIRALGLQPRLPQGKSYRDLYPATYSALGWRSSGVGPEEAFSTAPVSGPEMLYRSLTDNYQRLGAGGPTGGVTPRDGRMYLNPANLGANKRGHYEWAENLDQFLRNPSDDLLSAAADAKEFRRVRDAIPKGFKATADLAGVVPLFDPEFRQAVERGDVRTAGERVVEEAAAGTAAAAVMGLGAGVAARLAPQTTAAVLPVVAGATRIANPVAVVSQLGGSAKPSRRQQSIERQQDPAAFGAQGPSANPQLIKAEIARRQGGKWKIPGTNLKLPELGITETGSLSFRDTSQLLDALFPSRRDSKGSQGRRRGAAPSR